MNAFHVEAVALATTFSERAARLARFRARWRRRLSAEKRADILAVASALEALAGELRAVAAEPDDPIAAVVAQARALGVPV
jgi:hypothetical protein